MQIDAKFILILLLGFGTVAEYTPRELSGDDSIRPDASGVSSYIS